MSGTAGGPPPPRGAAAVAGFPLSVRGPFSLAASARIAERFPAGQGGGDTARLDLASPAEGSWQTIGVRVTDDADGLHATVLANPGQVDLVDVRRQVERILSLDVDGAGFPALGDRDRVVGDLQRRYPGLRPVQFHTPYEAAVWAIIGHRTRMTQAATIKARPTEQFGETVDVGDKRLPAFPAPDRLASLPVRGLPDRKIDQLRALDAPRPEVGSTPTCCAVSPATAPSPCRPCPASDRSPPSSSCCAALVTRTPFPPMNRGCTGP